MQMQRIAIVSVTNDLTTDQRVHRTCSSLVKAGFRVVLVGRILPGSLPLQQRDYLTHRMRLLFDKGALFYAEYNIRLLFFLLGKKFNLLISNDLDTLSANYTAFRLKNLFRKRTRHVHLIHDCHEYFRGVPELSGRIGVTIIWKFLEDLIFPRLKFVIAVNESVARLYHNEYGNEMVVVRNVPFRKQIPVPDKGFIAEKPAGCRMILYQGAVNIGRGLEEAIVAMNYLKTKAVLVIAGSGDILEDLRKLVGRESLQDKVILTGQIPFQELSRLTNHADIGLSIEKDISINYHYCLPNKFLDYIQACVPVLVSPFPEMKMIVERYQIGEFLTSHEPAVLAAQLDRMLGDEDKLKQFRSNLAVAAAELNWEAEEPRLMALLEPPDLR